MVEREEIITITSIGILRVHIFNVTANYLRANSYEEKYTEPEHMAPASGDEMPTNDHT